MRQRSEAGKGSKSKRAESLEECSGNEGKGWGRRNILQEKEICTLGLSDGRLGQVAYDLRHV